MAEWGNPAGREARHHRCMLVRRTWGTETSQYPEEEKSTEMPLVAASERGGAQTVLLGGAGLQDPQTVTVTVGEVPWDGAPETVRAR